MKEDPSLGEAVGNSFVLKAEILHAIRFEMAQKLSDVVLRRTDLATGEYPGEEAMQACGKIMAQELGWNQEKDRNGNTRNPVKISQSCICTGSLNKLAIESMLARIQSGRVLFPEMVLTMGSSV